MKRGKVYLIFCFIKQIIIHPKQSEEGQLVINRTISINNNKPKYSHKKKETVY